jgi:hypothetical protein
VKSEAREKVRGELATGPRPRSWTCWHWRGGRVKNDREWSKMGVVSEPAQQVQYVQVQLLQASSLSSGQLFTAPIASACSGARTHLHARPCFCLDPSFGSLGASCVWCVVYCNVRRVPVSTSTQSTGPHVLLARYTETEYTSLRGTRYTFLRRSTNNGMRSFLTSNVLYSVLLLRM